METGRTTRVSIIKITFIFCAQGAGAFREEKKSTPFAGIPTREGRIRNSRTARHRRLHHRGQPSNLFNHPTLLPDLELRVHWKRDDFRGDLLRDGEGAVLIFKGLISLLKVQRYWIMDSRANPGFRKVVPQNVSPLGTHHVEMINGSAPFGFKRDRQVVIR